MCEERLQELGLISLEKGRSLYCCMMGACQEGGARLSSDVQHKRE